MKKERDQIKEGASLSRSGSSNRKSWWWTGRYSIFIRSWEPV